MKNAYHIFCCCCELLRYVLTAFYIFTRIVLVIGITPPTIVATVFFLFMSDKDHSLIIWLRKNDVPLIIIK